MKHALMIYRCLVMYTGMTLIGCVASTLYLLSLGRLRRFNFEVLAPPFFRIMLYLMGIKLTVKNTKNDSRPGLYFFNHNSYLDLIILPALGLMNTRLITSTRTKKYLPLRLCHFGFGSLYLPYKDQKKERLQAFKNIAQRMVEEKFSVICSPEGVHTFRHKISPFNKGVFHLATVTEFPIYPLFIHIPKKSNPLEGFYYQSGNVFVTHMNTIDTDSWCLETLSNNKKNVRNLYIETYEEQTANA